MPTRNDNDPNFDEPEDVDTAEIIPAAELQAAVEADEQVATTIDESYLVHGANLAGKETYPEEYSDSKSREYLRQIRAKYDRWKAANFELKGPYSTSSTNDASLIKKRVELFNEYKDFIDQRQYAEHFDSRSNLHSSVLEEFMYYLFKDLVSTFSKHALVGKSHTFKDLFFMPSSYEDMVTKPNIRIERKDHDFVIGSRIIASAKAIGSDVAEQHIFDIPAVAIECKTYLDKTMLESSSTSAEQLKTRNPNAIYIVVMEWIKLTSNVNLKKFKVDQIYVFRKQKNTDRKYRFEAEYIKNPIYFDVVDHLFQTVRDHLTQPWTSGVNAKLEHGYLL